MLTLHISFQYFNKDKRYHWLILFAILLTNWSQEKQYNSGKSQRKFILKIMANLYNYVVIRDSFSLIDMLSIGFDLWSHTHRCDLFMWVSVCSSSPVSYYSLYVLVEIEQLFTYWSLSDYILISSFIFDSVWLLLLLVSPAISLSYYSRKTRDYNAIGVPCLRQNYNLMYCFLWFLCIIR